MRESSGSERKQLIRKIISKYKPVCNEDTPDNGPTVSQVTEPEPEPEPHPESD